MADKKATSPWVKLAIDFGPLLVFFLSFKLGDMFVATGAFMVASVVAMIASRVLTGQIAPMLKVTFVIVMVMGGLTLYLQDETFVKMKLTVINTLFAVVLLGGLLTGRLYIKMVMELAFEMDDDGWRKLTRNYVIFLTVMAVLNELIWRTQSDDFWVNFKTFGYMGATFVFILAQMPMLMKYMPDEDEDGGKA
ncbi:septation protein A [Kordiimonas gwangyangensis]|uniref:septation protein A n=1 Tax=Kordiimonas gwangyangensis TaxID=288022 RepID=UPI0003689A01|nr:septation protein A [Kordiimonas gwangyangensis]